MNKKLVQHGNSKALILDKPILKLLNIDDETILEIKIEGKSLVITPTKKKKKRKKLTKKQFEEAYEEIDEKYEEAFKKLAE